MENVSLTLWVTVFCYKGVKCLFGCLITCLKPYTKQYQSFIDFNYFLTTKAAHRAFILNILNDTTDALCKFTHQIAATCEEIDIVSWVELIRYGWMTGFWHLNFKNKELVDYFYKLMGFIQFCLKIIKW